MDSLTNEFSINLHLIKRFFTNDPSSFLSVLKTYETYYNNDLTKIKIELYLNKMMIFLLEILEEFHSGSEKDTIKKMLKDKCDNKYSLYTQSFDYFTEIQSILKIYNQKKNKLQIELSDIDPSDVISLKIQLDDEVKDQTSKNMVLNKSLVINILRLYINLA